MGISYGGRRSRVCIDARPVRANMRTAPPIQHWLPKGWTKLNPKLVQTFGEMGTSYGGLRARSAQRAIGAVQASRTSAKRESTGMEQGVATAASAKYERWARVISDRHRC
jgi:hypothetical protein